ncbi:MAG: hypothetical protein OEZ39_07885 [Gammaproteobacteria bacterium]|nr:hypothetical protein [Gammaproteobacteria bacterium]
MNDHKGVYGLRFLKHYILLFLVSFMLIFDCVSVTAAGIEKNTVIFQLLKKYEKADINNDLLVKLETGRISSGTDWPGVNKIMQPVKGAYTVYLFSVAEVYFDYHSNKNSIGHRYFLLKTDSNNIIQDGLIATMEVEQPYICSWYRIIGRGTMLTQMMDVSKLKLKPFCKEENPAPHTGVLDLLNGHYFNLEQ